MENSTHKTDSLGQACWIIAQEEQGLYYWQVTVSTPEPTEKQWSQWVFLYFRKSSKWSLFFLFFLPKTRHHSKILIKKKAFELVAYFMVWFSTPQVHFRNWWEPLKKRNVAVLVWFLTSICAVRRSGLYGFVQFRVCVLVSWVQYSLGSTAQSYMMMVSSRATEESSADQYHWPHGGRRTPKQG